MFPEVQRVIYKRTPLELVICQLKFAPILKIASEVPAAFQEAVRREYPIFRETVQVPQLPPEISNGIPKEALNNLLQTTRVYEFRSEDGEWVLALTRDFMALTATSYIRWEDFRKHLETPLKALAQCYQPAFYSRVGLRYQDVIRRSQLGLANAKWKALLRPTIASSLSDNKMADNIEEIGTVLLLKLSDNIKVRIQHGLVDGIVDDNKLSCYLIDNDFFVEQRIGAENVWNVLDELHSENGRLFRWLITDKLHDAMEPDAI